MSAAVPPEPPVDSAVRFLRSAESLLVAVILAVLLWLGQTTYANSILLTRLTTNVEHLLMNMANIKASSEALVPEIKEIRERVQRLEATHTDDASINRPWRN